MKSNRFEWHMRGFFAFSTLAMGACREAPPPIDARIWKVMRCIECIDGELSAVIAMRDTAVPALRYLLLYGPPRAIAAQKESVLSAPYYTGRGRGGTGRTVPPPAFVNTRLDDFRATLRIRSSLALGRIASDSAKGALCKAKSMQFRDDVQRAVDSALVLSHGNCP